MNANIEPWIQEALAGLLPAAAGRAAAHREGFGSDRAACSAVASRAAKLAQPKLLTLAFALCPEALGPGAEAFLGGLGAAAALFCLRHHAGLREAARAKAGQLRLEELREKAAEAARAERSARTPAVKPKKSGPRAAPVVIVRRRAARVDREALAKALGPAP